MTLSNHIPHTFIFVPYIRRHIFVTSSLHHRYFFVISSIGNRRNKVEVLSKYRRMGLSSVWRVFMKSSDDTQQGMAKYNTKTY